MNPIELKRLYAPSIDFTGRDRFEISFQAVLKAGENEGRFYTSVDYKAFLAVKKDIMSSNQSHTISFDLKGLSEFAESLSMVERTGKLLPGLLGFNREKVKEDSRVWFLWMVETSFLEFPEANFLGTF